MAKGKLEKTLGWSLIGINLLVITVGAFCVYQKTLDGNPLFTSEYELNRQLTKLRNKPQNPATYNLKPLSTNLAGVPSRFIRMEVSLEMLDAESFNEVKGVKSAVRDSIIRILNSKSFDELETVQGKLRLKNQMIAQINRFLHRGVVQNIYFSDFAVQ